MSTVEEKDPDVLKEYWIDFEDELVQLAIRREWFEEGTVLQYEKDTGFYYEVTVAGKSSSHYPHALPRESGETFQDGSVTLECKHPSDVTIPQASAVAWTVPDGITRDSDRTVRTKAFITLSGGTHGVDYEITCRMTPTAGNAIEKTIVVPVRSQ